MPKGSIGAASLWRAQPAVSASWVPQLVKRGMLTTSMEAARAWKAVQCSKFIVTCDIPNKVLAKASGVCERTLQRYFQKDVPRQCVVAASNWRAESKAQRAQLASKEHFHPKPGDRKPT